MLSTIAAMDPLNVASFIGAGVLLNLTPGSDVMFAAASGVSGGWRAGMSAAAGVSLGSLLHTVLAAAGIAALLAASPMAYEAIRWLGAGYLLYLAWRYWTAGKRAEGTRGAARLGRAVARGFLTNALNPKVALFILALLPQFTDPGLGPVWQQILVLGVLFSATGFVITAGYGALAGIFGAVLTAKTNLLNKLAAGVFGLLAARLVLD
jgi:threonine/homoserine/homoserine lactone efflux protein